MNDVDDESSFSNEDDDHDNHEDDDDDVDVGDESYVATKLQLPGAT